MSIQQALIIIMTLGGSLLAARSILSYPLSPKSLLGSWLYNHDRNRYYRYARRKLKMPPKEADCEAERRVVAKWSETETRRATLPTREFTGELPAEEMAKKVRKRLGR